VGGTDLLRIVALTESLSEQLQEYAPLVTYARGMERFAHGDRDTASDIFNKVFGKKQKVEISGVKLQRPKEIRTKSAATISVSASKKTQESETISRDIKSNESLSSQFFEPETIFIPAGSFVMGAKPEKGVPDYETPQHEVFLKAYRIGKYPITNAQYNEFIRQTGTIVTPNTGWNGQKAPRGSENYPVTGVTWYDALAYCQWLSQKTGRNYSLPNEAQWEKACRGDDNRIYPWGDQFDANRCNQGHAQVALVDAYLPQSVYGCYDFVGNVRQWTCTLWGEKHNSPDPSYLYPWSDDSRNDLHASRQIRRVVRGSSFKDDPTYSRCSARSGQLPDDADLLDARHGFRVVITLASDEKHIAEQKTHLFLSYKRNVQPDQKLADYLVEKLSGEGITVFIDTTMRLGENWLERIDEEIKKSDFLVVLFSETSADSEMVQSEIQRAYEYRRLNGRPQVLPIRVAFDKMLPYTVSAFLNPLQYIVWDSESDNERVAQEIIQFIQVPLSDKDAYRINSSQGENISKPSDVTVLKEGIEEFQSENTMELRKNEIENLIASNELNTATKRVLDFVSDFSKNRKRRQEAIDIRATYNATREEIRRYGKTDDENQSLSQLRNRILGFIDDVKSEYLIPQEPNVTESQSGIEKTQSQKATEELQQLRSEFSVDILADWGEDSDGIWHKGNWTINELEKLYKSIGLLASAMGGPEKIIQNLNGITIRKADVGSHGGEALSHSVSLSTKGTFSAWTVVHELAHAWDANFGWQLSVTLEKYTGGTTNRLRSRAARLLGNWDAGPNGEENTPGRHGRLPGCNAAGYFYGDKPSGSNWYFNRKEDFAESVAMYVGWKKNNELSDWAEIRINRFLLENGARDKNFGVDNWADYKKYFYPDSGDYTKTKRWQFIDDLINGKLRIS